MVQLTAAGTGGLILSARGFWMERAVRAACLWALDRLTRNPRWERRYRSRFSLIKRKWERTITSFKTRVASEHRRFDYSRGHSG